MTDSDEVKLLPCRACGEKCRVERFEGDQIDGVMTIYMCANSTKFGGICPDPHAYLNVNAWNTRPPVVTDEVVERVRADLEHPAVVSSIKFLRGRYQRARCDSEAVSDCVNCNTMFLIGTIERSRKALASMPAVVSGGQGDA